MSNILLRGVLTQVIAENKRCLGVEGGGVGDSKTVSGGALVVDKATVLYGESRGVMGERGTVEIVSVQYSGRDNVPKVGIQ